MNESINYLTSINRLFKLNLSTSSYKNLLEYNNKIRQKIQLWLRYNNGQLLIMLNAGLNN